MAFKSKCAWAAVGAALAVFTAGVAAQEAGMGWNPRSGDAWVDNQLDDMNRYGSRYRDPFVDEMVRYHDAPRALVTELLVTRRWSPGDVYYACAIAQVLGRPCRYVVDAWDRNRDTGWGEVARELGITPGSAEFHRIKAGFVPTYDRWARPIEIDRDLRKDFPDRGKARKRPGAAAAPGKPAIKPAANDAQRTRRSKGADHGAAPPPPKHKAGKRG